MNDFDDGFFDEAFDIFDADPEDLFDDAMDSPSYD